MKTDTTEYNCRDRYTQVYRSLPALAAGTGKSGKVPVLGQTSNLDIVLSWDAARYNAILENYLTVPPSSHPGDVMETVEDFARISADFLIRGLGGNFDIGTQAVCDFLRASFDTELALGGTCAQGAAALGALGIPVNVHISDASREVCALMDYPGLTTIWQDRVVPLAEAATAEAPICHFILQFRKGDIIRVKGEEYTIPSSNRLILFYDRMQKDPPFRPEFFSYWEAAKTPPASVLFSGFDAILDEAVARKKTDALLSFLRKLRARTPDLPAYFEGAFYMNPAVKLHFLKALGPEMTLVGMNEEELEAQVTALGKTAELTQLEGILAALDEVKQAFGLQGIVLHSKDYALYRGKELPGVSMEDGLTMGNLMAATRARTGRYGTREDLKETLSVPLSPAGLALAEEAAKRQKEEQALFVVPSLYLEHPKYTVGLGDTFVAGVHTCFLSGNKEA